MVRTVGCMGASFNNSSVRISVKPGASILDFNSEKSSHFNVFATSRTVAQMTPPELIEPELKVTTNVRRVDLTVGSIILIGIIKN